MGDADDRAYVAPPKTRPQEGKNKYVADTGKLIKEQERLQKGEGGKRVAEGLWSERTQKTEEDLHIVNEAIVDSMKEQVPGKPGGDDEGYEVPKESIPKDDGVPEGADYKVRKKPAPVAAEAAAAAAPPAVPRQAAPPSKPLAQEVEELSLE